MSLGQFQKYLDGSLPGMDVLLRIVEKTGCSAAWLLTGEGEPYPQPDPKSEAARASVAQAVDELVATAHKLRAAIDLLRPALSPDQRQRLADALAGPDPAPKGSA